MRSYPAENWKRLGKWVHDARLRAGWTNMSEWALHVERSTRQLQGLERGERVGEKTLGKIAESLNRELGVLIDILAEDDELADSESEPMPVKPQVIYSGPEQINAMIRQVANRLTALEERLDAIETRREGGTSDVESDAAQKMNDDGDDQGEGSGTVTPITPTKPSQGPASVDLSQEPSAAAPKRRDRGQGDDDA